MIPLDVDVYVALEPIDLRMSFDLLSGVVRDRRLGDPKSGAMYIFFGKRRDKLKAIFYDQSGYVILYKRLCRGTFRIPEPERPGDAHVRMDDQELGFLLAGMEVAPVARKRTEKIH